MSKLPTRRELRWTLFTGVLKSLLDKKKKGKGKRRREIHINQHCLPHTELESGKKLHWSIVGCCFFFLISAKSKCSNQVLCRYEGIWDTPQGMESMS